LQAFAVCRSYSGLC